MHTSSGLRGGVEDTHQERDGSCHFPHVIVKLHDLLYARLNEKIDTEHTRTKPQHTRTASDLQNGLHKCHSGKFPSVPDSGTWVCALVAAPCHAHATNLSTPGYTARQLLKNVL